VNLEAWNERVVEEANLFNPAFCAMLIAKACKDYSKKGPQPLSFPLAFLVLPLIVHPGTRAALPYSTMTSLISWTQEHQVDLVEFGTHTRHLLPYTREAIMFGLAHNILTLDESGGINIGKSYVALTEKKTELFTHEVRDCLDRAGFVGRWFAGAGTASTIYSVLGVRP
jgi:hypothetical protein